MSINVKDPKADQLVRAITDVTGETITAAVIHALEERLKRVSNNQHKPEMLEAELHAIAKRSAEHIRKLNRPDMNPDDFFYDEYGLPK